MKFVLFGLRIPGKNSKCVHRAAQAKSALKPNLSLSLSPEKGPAGSQSSGSASNAPVKGPAGSQSSSSASQDPVKGPGLLIFLPCDGALASLTTITRTKESESNAAGRKRFSPPGSWQLCGF